MTTPTRIRPSLSKVEIVQRIANMQCVGKSPMASKLRPPKRPNHRCSDYLQSPSTSAQVISFEDNGHNFTLNSTYNEQSVVSYLNQCFEIVSQIGEGSFGNVFKVKDKTTHELFAIKVSKIKYRSKNDRDAKLREVKWHIVLPSHPNCVRLYNAWEQDANLYIQIELCIASLDMLIQYNLNNQNRFDENSLWEIFYDILQGLQNLHERDFVHMDIKSANIFISTDGVCKLGDFGLVLDLAHASSSEEEGDSKYLAAEVLDGVYTKSADIFSLGIVILELATLIELPKCGPAWQDLRHGYIPLQFIEHLSEEMKDVIIRMINPKHSLRPSTADLLNHPRFKFFKWKRFAQQIAKKVKKAITPITSCVIEAIHILLDPLANLFNILATRYSMRQPIKMTTPCEYQSEDEDSYTAFASHFKVNNVNKLTTPMRQVVNSTPIVDTPLLCCRSSVLKHSSSKPNMEPYLVSNRPTKIVSRFDGVRRLHRGKNLFSEFAD